MHFIPNPNNTEFIYLLGLEAVVDDDEVVVGIEWEAVGIKRPRGLVGRLEERFGKGTRRGEKREAEGGAMKEAAAVEAGREDERGGFHGALE